MKLEGVVVIIALLAIFFTIGAYACRCSRLLREKTAAITQPLTHGSVRQ